MHVSKTDFGCRNGSPWDRSAGLPKCGLALQVVDVGERPSLRYDFPAWDRQCLFPLLGGPSACLSMQAGAITRPRQPRTG